MVRKSGRKNRSKTVRTRSESRNISPKSLSIEKNSQNSNLFCSSISTRLRMKNSPLDITDEEVFVPKIEHNRKISEVKPEFW